MIAVGLVGLVIFGCMSAMRMGSRAKSYRSRASTWQMIEAQHRKHLVLCQNEVDVSIRTASNLRLSLSRINAFQAVDLARQIAGQAVWWRANLAHTEEMIAYSSMMRQKYERAAHYPWLVIAPDPPQPYWSGTTGAAPEDPPDILEEHPAQRAAGIAERLLKTVVEQ